MIASDFEKTEALGQTTHSCRKFPTSLLENSLYKSYLMEINRGKGAFSSKSKTEIVP